MAEGKSAIPNYNQLIVSHFLSFSDFTPHFAPHNFLSIMAFKGRGSFISEVTDWLWLSALGLIRGVGVKRAGSAARGPRFYDGLAKLSDRGFIWVQHVFKNRNLFIFLTSKNNKFRH